MMIKFMSSRSVPYSANKDGEFAWLIYVYELGAYVLSYRTYVIFITPTGS